MGYYPPDRLYIGPAVFLEPLELIIEDEEYVCPTPSCKRDTLKTAFCPDCGAEQASRPTEDKRQAGYSDFLVDDETDNFDDVFTYDDHGDQLQLWPNDLSGLSCWNDSPLDDEPPTIDDLTADDMREHIAMFKDRYRKVLEALSAYGFDYTIRYAVRAY